ncbi:hypothetical protein BGZ83_008334 [Gryganskiella cystojenkinii]|nr:hypothetical protein BGZ83_008334 [Gryganskiella cystojenkinii]
MAQSVIVHHNSNTLRRRSLYIAAAARDHKRETSEIIQAPIDAAARSHQAAAEQEKQTVRENAIRERQKHPNYGGWWTEILNYHQTPQTLPDPTLLLSEDHVFQGRPATAAPTKTEINKGYANSLPSAKSASSGNTLPTAVSTGSATFATGTESSLSRSSPESTPYHGFSIPIKPSPPGAEDCCMSGCAHCIYDIYEEDRQEYKRKLAEVLAQIENAGLPPPPNLKTAASSTKPGETASTKDEDDSDMDPGMKAFLALERKLKGA